MIIFKNFMIILIIVTLSGCAQSMAGVDSGAAGFFSGLLQVQALLV